MVTCMSRRPARFEGSKAIFLLLAVGVAFELFSLVMIVRGFDGQIPVPVPMPFGLALILLALVLGLLRARRQPPGGGPSDR